MRLQAPLRPPRQVAHEFASGLNRCQDRQCRQHTKGLTYVAAFAEDVAADMTQQMEQAIGMNSGEGRYPEEVMVVSTGYVMRTPKAPQSGWM
jgi:hypothetical protein